MARTTKPANDGKLEDIVAEAPKDAEAPKRSRVAYISEVAYDTEYFERPDSQQAYSNLLEFLSQDRSVTGILIDGAITRLDRPEFLNERLTYWDKSEEECREATEQIPNSDQYMTMMRTQLSIVDERLRELRQRVPHARQITFSLHSDDLQYTASAMLNELLIRKQARIGDKIEKLKVKKKDLKKKRTAFERDFKKLKGKRGGARDRATLKRKINTCTTKVDNIEEKLTDLYEEQQLYREKKVRPIHQHTTNTFLQRIYSMYKGICDKYGVRLVTGEDKLVFDDHLTIDYSHSRHKTWHPVKGRDKNLVKEVHGELRKLKGSGIDVKLESGHFGMGFKQLQKLMDSPEENNFLNQSDYVSKTCDEHITVVLALPFENTAAIGEYCKGRKAIRMSGGKPMSTRKTAATDRYYNGGVSGLTIIEKDEQGIVRTDWIQYQNFVDGAVLRQPEEYSMIAASSDEHMRSPESNPIVTDGWVERFKSLVAEGTVLRGRKAFVKGYLNAGDMGEANSRKWRHLYHHQRAPEEVMDENIRLLADFHPESIDEVIALAIRKTNDSMGGSVESMDDILDSVADYLERFLDPLLAGSMLRHLLAVTEGNHSGDILRDLGLRETNFFRQRLKAKGLKPFEVGKPGYMQDMENARVVLGGYSNARIFQITDYGMGVDGRPMFGPINLVVQHDPKGSGMGGVIGAGKNAGADLSIGGHTHDNVLKLYKTDDNQFGVAYKLATMQGVSPTEKYYASSVPRTQAAQELVMPMPGDFSEKTIPVGYLRDEGMAAIRRKAEAHLKKRKGCKCRS